MEIKRYGEKEFLSADKLYIRENEIHIWCIRWPEMTDFWKNHEYILSGQELEQAGRFRFPEDRMRYIAGKVVVRILLKRYLDMETIDFSVNELGKPYHKKIAGKRTVDFNISHSGEFILAVFAVGMDIGVDVQEMDCDFYAFSGHKIYAATGTGVLYGKKKFLEAMPPFLSGGEMVGTVTLEDTTFAPLPMKFEAGTQNVIGQIGRAHV